VERLLTGGNCFGVSMVVLRRCAAADRIDIGREREGEGESLWEGRNIIHTGCDGGDFVAGRVVLVVLFGRLLARFYFCGGFLESPRLLYEFRKG
jgi:hypothetical protein